MKVWRVFCGQLSVLGEIDLISIWYHAVVAFSSIARILGECSTIHILPALNYLFILFEISWCTLIPLFRPGSVHIGLVS